MGKRRKFSGESKREAVQMTMVPETTIRQVAKDPGISERLLGRWKRDLETHGGKTFVGQGHARDADATSRNWTADSSSWTRVAPGRRGTRIPGKRPAFRQVRRITSG